MFYILCFVILIFNTIILNENEEAYVSMQNTCARKGNNMLRGLYTASTVLEQNTKELNVISNNLANIKTTGFKKDISLYEEFKSQLLYKVGGNPLKEQRDPINVEVKEQNGFFNAQTKGGFFRVAAINGDSYNTSLAFRRDNDGYLKTYYKNANGQVIEGKGFKVLGKNGAIKVEEGQKIEVDKKGNLLLDGKVVDNLIFEKPKGVIGTMSGGVKLMRTAINFEQGEFIQTHNPLDLLIEGEGFFVVNTPLGERYTRDGSFKLTADGTLVTDEGYEVQGIDGQITGLKGKIGVNEFGEILQDGQIVDKIRTINPKRDEFLKKSTTNLYRYDAELTEEEKESPVTIIQGALEGSNVNEVEEMVKMIETYRSYESANKLVRTYDETLSRSVNDIGKV